MIDSAPGASTVTRAEPGIEPTGGRPEAELPRAGRFFASGSLRSRAARGTLINALFTVAIGLLGLVKGFVLAGFLSRSDYGVWGIIVVSLSTLLWVKQTGIGDKYIQQDELDQRLAFQKAFTIELVFTGVCALLIVIAIPVLVAIYNLPQLVAPSLVIAGVLMISTLQSPLWVYYRRMEFARQRTLAAVDPVVGFVTSIALAVAGAGYWAFVGGFAAGVCASSAIAVMSAPFPLRVRYQRGTLGAYWSFSGPLLLAGGAAFVMAWAAVITAKIDLGVAAVGVIALAANITSFTDRVDELVTGSLYPAICAVKDETALLYESLVKSNRLALMWAVPFGVGVTLFCSDLVRFGIGERWRAAVIVLQVYGIAAAVNHVGFNWTAYFRALGRTRPIAITSVAATTVFLVAGIPLLLTMGLRGFAFGVLLQGLAALSLRAYYLEQLFPGFDFLRHAVRSFLPTVPAAAAVLVLRAIEPAGSTLAAALAELGIYVLVTALATWYLESNLLREALGYVFGRPVPQVAS
ncbi:MAG TPA: oligosaccharide flippase family protein [Solirubrobacteraceae bacterium]|nr:oligosaccharide flippase family protein [Solirubrobacteraceae bacterium]